MECGRSYGSKCPASSSKIIVDMRKFARPPKKSSPMAPNPPSTLPMKGKLASPFVAHQKATHVARSHASEHEWTLKDKPSLLKKSSEQCRATQVHMTLATAGKFRKFVLASPLSIAVFMSKEQLNAREHKFMKLSKGITRLRLLCNKFQRLIEVNGRL